MILVLDTQTTKELVEQELVHSSKKFRHIIVSLLQRSFNIALYIIIKLWIGRKYET